jgi:hypothetical protein
MKTFYHFRPNADRTHRVLLLRIFTCTKLLCAFTIFSLLTTNQSLAQEPKSNVNFLSALSQDDELKLSAKNVSQAKQLDQMKIHKKIQLIKVGNLAKVQKKGVLSFTLPGDEERITFYAKSVNAESEATYKWIGHSTDKLSTAIFISKNDYVTGSFNVNNRYFQLYPAEDGISILIEERTDLNLKCDTEGHAHSLKADTLQQKKNSNGARAGVCTEPMRVLVVYTQNAANSVPNINAVIDLSIQQYNTTVDNSGIGGTPQTNYIQEAGRQQVTFGTNSPETTTDPGTATTRVRDNANIQNLRNQFSADLVVCLVEQTYADDVIGNAANIPASNFDYCAIVRAPFSSSAGFFTFTHEVGHLLGGRHQDDGGGPSYSHGYQFTTNTSTTVRTMMHRFANGSTRIMNFSNPNVNVGGVPSGTFNFNYVAKRVSEVSVNIVNFRPSVTQSFNAYIDGPDYISQSGYYNWELLTFCRNFQTTNWQFSTDGFNYGSSVGAGDAVNFYYVDEYSNGTLYLRCNIVTDQNQNYTAYKTININICPGCRKAVANKDQENASENELSMLYPNPAGRKITISYSVKSTSDVEFEFIDLIGKSRLKKALKDVPYGDYREELDVAHLADGMYVCRVKMGNKIYNRSFIVSK